MSIFQELAKKPRPADPAKDDGLHAHDHITFFLPAGKVGLRVFLTVVTVLFALTLIAYANRMSFPTWTPMPDPGVLWLNTALLICASMAMEWSRGATRRDSIDGVRGGLLWGGVLTLAFLAGQLFVWKQLADLGYYADTNTANSFFYLLTAMHGLHLLGGLVAWGRCVSRIWRGGSVDDLRLSVELCTVYWHYLLLVWLVLFGLLLNS